MGENGRLVGPAEFAGNAGMKQKYTANKAGNRPGSLPIGSEKAGGSGRHVIGRKYCRQMQLFWR